MKLEHIEYPVQWKIKDIANAFPHQAGHLLIIFFFEVLHFIEKCFIALRTLG
jgi:hypothetical protein